jgi:phosphatidylinositol transfer protein SFH5
MADQPTEESSQTPETKELAPLPTDSSEGQPLVVESEPTAVPAIPEPKTEAQSTDPAWPELAADHPLSKLSADLPTILEKAGYDEVYGLRLSDATPFHTKLILQKFLRANANDLDKAKEQLLGTLKWRKEFQPLKTVEEEHSKDKFGGLGYITVLSSVPGSSNEKDAVTFNIYGAVKDNQKTFGDIERLVTSPY